MGRHYCYCARLPYFILQINESCPHRLLTPVGLGHPDGQSGDIDKTVKFPFEQVAPGDLEKVTEDGGSLIASSGTKSVPLWLLNRGVIHFPPHAAYPFIYNFTDAV
jgi:hypothetical protein